MPESKGPWQGLQLTLYMDFSQCDTQFQIRKPKGWCAEEAFIEIFGSKQIRSLKSGALKKSVAEQ
jgi:hypothetical protein